MMVIEPGGYIQWDELDCATFHAHAPTESLTTQGTSDLLTRWQGFCRKSGLDFRSVTRTDSASPLMVWPRRRGGA